ncbi:MAG: hypothetical protein ACI8ZB_004360 [Desulforhopalus sp.]|jgi:hypothetical protein
MGKHDKPTNPHENDDLESDSIQEEINRIFKEHPHNPISKLEELGFTYFDDEPDEEKQKEVTAKPENKNQEHLVSFFSGNIQLSDNTLEIFLEERRRPDPNFPLFRKYFRAANKHLLSLILDGLHRYPVLDELLTDLAYFHEFQNILSTLIEHYTVACDEQANLEIFSETAMDFYYATIEDGYDALYALKERYPVNSDKRKVVDFLNEIEDAGVDEEDDDVEF